MTTLNDLFPSKYLKSADLKGKEAEVVIESIKQETFESDGTTKPIVKFKGKDKGLVLNVTNGKIIAKAYGQSCADWIDKPVILVEREVEYKGDMVPAIRIKVPAQKAPEPDYANELDDDIPF